jgi:hypothetical protein
MCFIGLKILSVSLWPFPAIWDYFLISLGDTRSCELVGGGVSVNRDRAGKYSCFSFTFFFKYILMMCADDLTLRLSTNCLSDANGMHLSMKIQTESVLYALSLPHTNNIQRDLFINSLIHLLPTEQKRCTSA